MNNEFRALPTASRIPLQIFTIGHSTRSLHQLISVLQNHRIKYLVDIRRFPFSRRHPHFNIDILQDILPAEGIHYIHLPEMGGRRKGGMEGYKKHMQTDAWKKALETLLNIAREGRCAIMCAEKLPWKCHRWLVSKHLHFLGIQVIHIIDEKRVYIHREDRVVPSLFHENPSGRE